MYNVGKVIDSEVLEEMVEDCLSGTRHTLPSKVSKNAESEGRYDNVRTSKNFCVHHCMYPEFCEQLEDWVGDGTKVNQIDILLYEKGDKFDCHKDESEDVGTRGKRHWSTSTILHLSEDFVGDGLRIYTDTSTGDYIVPRQEVGDTVIFKSKQVPHEAAPVERGTRIVAVAWLDFK